MSLAVIGATSKIAESTARIFYQHGHDLFLVARNTSKLGLFSTGEKEFNPSIETLGCDIQNEGSLDFTASRIIASFSDDPYVLVAVGSVDNADETKVSASAAKAAIDVNFRNLIALITPIAEKLEERGNGCIIFISSVSGERGRQTNYVYGAAKAAITVFSQGLRGRLFDSGVHVLTVKPGYVDTPMLRTALGDKYNQVPRFLIGDADKVGYRIYRSAVSKRNIVYVPPIWRLIMAVVCSIPESLFKKIRF